MSGFALGIDIGTTSTKAVLVDPRGSVVGYGSASNGLREHPGIVEADPEQWWESTRAAVSELDARDRARVWTVGLAGNMSSVVLMDRHVRALRPAILLADGRGEAELGRLPASVRARIEENSNNVAATVFGLAKLLWLAEHEPDSLARAHTLGAAKDFVRAKMTGVFRSERTDAFNTLLLDRNDLAWRPDLIRDCGLDPALFPTLSEPDTAAKTTNVAAAELGIPSGVAVAAGMGDMAAALFGAAATESPGTVLVSLGTLMTALVRLPETGLDPALRGQLTYHPLPTSGSFALASMLIGGLAVNWLRSLVGSEALRAAPDEPDPDSPLVFVPQLAGAGSPDFLPAARGSLFGIEPGTSGPHLARALFEGTAFELAANIRLAGGERVLLSGGGTQLPAWVQIITDVLDMPTRRIEQSEVSAIGAARAAWHAVGAVCQPVADYREFLPRPEFGTAWRARRARYEAARSYAFAYYREDGKQ